MTDSPVSKQKRLTDNKNLTFEEWRDRVDRAKVLETDHLSQNHTRSLNVRSQNSSVRGQWWGACVHWVKKLTSATKSDGSMLSMGLVRSLALYSGCL